MPITLICPKHHRRHPKGTRCPECPAKRGRNSAAREAQRRFHDAVLAAAGHRCQWILEDDTRCTATLALEAAHLDPYEVDGNFAAGAALCSVHHRAFDRRRRHRADIRLA